MSTKGAGLAKSEEDMGLGRTAQCLPVDSFLRSPDLRKD
jgi:hypothetical protein